MSNPLVSIIIPTYNRENLISETLTSIIEQTYTQWECIIVDDGSTDATLEVVNTYLLNDSRFKLYIRSKTFPKGANSCRNFGFEKSKGSYINWFDSDDLMHPQFIEKKIKAFLPKTDCVLSKTQFFKDSIQNIIGKEDRTYFSEHLVEDFTTLKVSWYLPDPMWKRSFLEGKSLFSVSLLKGQDRDFHIRMLLEHPSIVFIDSYLTYYRQHDNTISSSNSVLVSQSIINALEYRITQFQKIGMSKDLKFFLLKQHIKNYPVLFKTKGAFTKSIQAFKTLFVFNSRNLIWFCKFILAALFLELSGKGSIFLKG